MVGLDRLAALLPSGLVLGLLACAAVAGLAGVAGYGVGYRHADALGAARLSDLQQVHAEQARLAAEASRVQLLQQVTRANLAEAQLLGESAQLDAEQQPLQERIPHVTTTYRSALAAAPVPVPHCVFTAGWLRDYNTALGVSAPAAGTAAADAQAAAWPTPGADAELLESGVTPADILAHAQDYGRWARRNLAQLNALLDLHKE